MTGLRAPRQRVVLRTSVSGGPTRSAAASNCDRKRVFPQARSAPSATDVRLPVPPRQASLAELPSLVAEITAGTIAVEAITMPLADVEQIWSRTEVPGERTVLVP
jgi:hypothetical protein